MVTSLLRRKEFQGEGELGPLAFFRRQPDAAAMSFDDAADQRTADDGAGRLAAMQAFEGAC